MFNFQQASLDEKDYKLTTLTNDLETSRGMQHVIEGKLKKEVEVVKRKLSLERSLKNEAFNKFNCAISVNTSNSFFLNVSKPNLFFDTFLTLQKDYKSLNKNKLSGILIIIT